MRVEKHRVTRWHCLVCSNSSDHEATWRCPACGWRCSSAWPDWTPRSGWSHRELALGQWSSTRPCVSPWSRPSSCLSVGLVAPGLCKPKEAKSEATNISIYQVKVWKMYNSITNIHCFCFYLAYVLSDQTAHHHALCVHEQECFSLCWSAQRHLLEAKLTVGYSPNLLSLKRWDDVMRFDKWLFCVAFKGPTTRCRCCHIHLKLNMLLLLHFCYSTIVFFTTTKQWWTDKFLHLQKLFSFFFNSLK